MQLQACRTGAEPGQAGQAAGQACIRAAGRADRAGRRAGRRSGWQVSRGPTEARRSMESGPWRAEARGTGAGTGRHAATGMQDRLRRQGRKAGGRNGPGKPGERRPPTPSDMGKYRCQLACLCAGPQGLPQDLPHAGLVLARGGNVGSLGRGTCVPSTWLAGGGRCGGVIQDRSGQCAPRDLPHARHDLARGWKRGRPWGGPKADPPPGLPVVDCRLEDPGVPANPLEGFKRG